MMAQIMASLNVSYMHILGYAQKFVSLAKFNFENIEYMKKIDSFTGKDH